MSVNRSSHIARKEGSSDTENAVFGMEEYCKNSFCCILVVGPGAHKVVLC